MRLLAFALVAALGLAGCQTTVDKVDDVVQHNLPNLCAIIGTAHASFRVIQAAIAEALRQARAVGG